MNVTIRTRYVTRAGSNVGTYKATGAGRTFTAPARQDLNASEREEIAARALASIIAGFDAANVREWARRTESPAYGDTNHYLHAVLTTGPTPPARVRIRRENDGGTFPSERVTVWTVEL